MKRWARTGAEEAIDETEMVPSPVAPDGEGVLVLVLPLPPRPPQRFDFLFPPSELHQFRRADGASSLGLD